jgi:hypothetical protein
MLRSFARLSSSAAYRTSLSGIVGNNNGGLNERIGSNSNFRSQQQFQPRRTYVEWPLAFGFFVAHQNLLNMPHPGYDQQTATMAAWSIGKATIYAATFPLSAVWMGIDWYNSFAGDSGLFQKHMYPMSVHSPKGRGTGEQYRRSLAPKPKAHTDSD